MPSTLFLLLTILTVPVVPHAALPSRSDGRANAPARASSHAVAECPLRVGAAGVPLVRVHVSANRAAWFAVDTGATGTTVHPGLATELGLAASGETRIATADGRARVPAVWLRDFSIAGVPTLYQLEAAVHDMALVRQVAPEAEGILGQDVLAQDDYLIDFMRRRLIVGRFPPPADGVRVPVTWSAGRPVLHWRGRRATHGLVLDTGADVLVMEAGASRDALGSAWSARRVAALETHFGRRDVEVEHHVSLRLADVRLGPADVVRLPSDAWTMSPEVGLLPGSLFAKVYVSARQGEAVVWER